MHVLVFAGGVSAGAIAVPEHDLVIAADSGYVHARAAKVDVDVLLGDFDSISTEALEEAEASGVAIVRFPTAKDATDLEIALDEAQQRGATRITVFGGGGGRLDHLLGNLLVLCNQKYRSIELVFIDDLTRATVIHDRAVLQGGKTVSLFAIGGDAVVTTEGLLYALDHGTLSANSSHGVSNEMLSDEATVTVSQGTVLAVSTS